MTLLSLYCKAENDNIKVLNFPLPHNESCSVMDSQGNCYIGIDQRQVKNSVDEKCKLAHEMGHCETGSFYNPYSRFDIQGRHEVKANRWSYKTLVPLEEIEAAIQNGYYETWEIAEYLDIPEKMLIEAIEYYKICNSDQ